MKVFFLEVKVSFLPGYPLSPFGFGLENSGPPSSFVQSDLDGLSASVIGCLSFFSFQPSTIRRMLSPQIKIIAPL